MNDYEGEGVRLGWLHAGTDKNYRDGGKRTALKFDLE